MNTILELKDISKSFGPVKVLDGIDMTIEPGKVYVLAGENGAGKSTLCNIISGALQPSSGTVIFGGREHSYVSIDEAKNQIGVRMGDWKMVVKRGKPFLYNLAEDIHEDHDVAAEHPEIVKQMKEVIKSQHIPNPNFSVTLPDFD